MNDISASTIQVVLNQCLGLLIFYLFSLYLPKEIFGQFNWGLASSALLIAIISIGMDAVIIKRIAHGDDKRQIIGLHFIHVLATGTMLSATMLVCYFLLADPYTNSILLPCIFLSTLLTSFASPFRQLANGTRAFRHLAIISCISPVIKTLLLLVCVWTDNFSIINIALIYIAGSTFELLAGLFITVFITRIKLFPLYWNSKHYFTLVKESMPQYGASIFNIVLARFDWIMLGLLTTSVITAEYSFAYKVFELSRLPLLIISPLLIPIFVKLFNDKHTLSAKTQLKFDLLFRIEMFISVLIPILLVSCWSPLMGFLTNGKYGEVNAVTFMLLSVCVPLQFATDYFWNLCFAQNQMRLTFLIFACTAIANITLNFLLLPYIGAIGAAIAYLGCFVLQLALFKRYTKQDKVKPNFLVLIKIILSAIIALWITRYITQHIIIAPVLSLLLYVLFSILTQIVIPQKIKPALKLFALR